ncbi:hypothetical protein JZ751_021989 [Albula glossodonta]|uniref:CNH domain-containing protein n=1 Tax=Albula glossodonta TaxID=121402 RepID=A0A8T2NII7_9TELE|nr:hypothetical protein JZ751_021989 [Albula glossodonta]
MLWKIQSHGWVSVPAKESFFLSKQHLLFPKILGDMNNNFTTPAPPTPFPKKKNSQSKFQVEKASRVWFWRERPAWWSVWGRAWAHCGDVRSRRGRAGPACLGGLGGSTPLLPALPPLVSNVLCCLSPPPPSPPSPAAYIHSNQIMGWGEKAIEIRSVETGHLDGVFMHKRAQRLKFLSERNDKVFFASVRSGGSSQVFFMTLNRNSMMNW